MGNRKMILPSVVHEYLIYYIMRFRCSKCLIPSSLKAIRTDCILSRIFLKEHRIASIFEGNVSNANACIILCNNFIMIIIIIIIIIIITITIISLKANRRRSIQICTRLAARNTCTSDTCHSGRTTTIFWKRKF